MLSSMVLRERRRKSARRGGLAGRRVRRGEGKGGCTAEGPLVEAELRSQMGGCRWFGLGHAGWTGVGGGLGWFGGSPEEARQFEPAAVG